MPFAVFRQHQRSLLAIFALLAMIGFVLSDTLPRWMNSGGMSDRDLVVAELYGKKIHLSDINIMRLKRSNANRFMTMATRYSGKEFFNGTTRSEMIDAIILQHEADRLGIPAGADFAREWIDNITSGAMNAALFESILQGFDKKMKMSGEELLIQVASQRRLQLASLEVAMPIVTPLDVFRNYRDQTELTSFKVVPFLAQSYFDKVGQPTASEITALYDKYKNVLPDPTSPTPGFKIPRQVKVEFLGLDVNAISRRIKAKLPEADVKTYYESKKKDYLVDRELPADVFAGAPELTPAQYIPFSELRDSMADALARDKARDEVQDIFATIHEEVIDKFADKYQAVVDDIAEAKKDGSSTDAFVLPKPDDLIGVARKYGMTHEITPLLDRREAEGYGRISLTTSGGGGGLSGEAKKFADVTFDPRTVLFEGYELSDISGDRYLLRKTADIAAHVADLKEVEDQVIRAWKIDKARVLARKAADEVAAKLKTEGGQIKDLMINDRPVVAIDAITRLKPGKSIPPRFPDQFMSQRGPATATELLQIPNASSSLLDSLFSLKPGDVVVEPDLPNTTYYVLTLEKRQPVSYMSLMGPNGSLASYWSETQNEVMKKAFDDGMRRLREEAGYHPEDYPTETGARETDTVE